MMEKLRGCASSTSELSDIVRLSEPGSMVGWTLRVSMGTGILRVLRSSCFFTGGMGQRDTKGVTKTATHINLSRGTECIFQVLHETTSVRCAGFIEFIKLSSEVKGLGVILGRSKSIFDINVVTLFVNEICAKRGL